MNELPPLSSRALAALEVERSRPPPDPAVVTRMTARLDALAATGVATAQAAAAANLVKAKVLFLALGLGLGGAGGVAVGYRLAETGAGPPLSLAPVPPAPAANAAQQRDESAPYPKASEATLERPTDTTKPAVVPQVTPVVEPPRHQDSEQLLLERATAALMRGRAEQTIEVCHKLAATYPSGVLVEERESLAIRALVVLDRQAEAEERAASFRRRFPDSLLLPVIEDALRQP